MEDSKIEWTTHTFNPWVGCSKVSAGCTNCFAEKISNRFGDHWGPSAERKMLGDDNWKKPLRWNRKAEKLGECHRVFCASMADVFEIHRDPSIDKQLSACRNRLWHIIEATPNLSWLLLTKRPENFSRLLPLKWTGYEMPSNIWLGVTAENQEQANNRIPQLLSVDAAVHFLSYEPAIEEVDFGLWMYCCPRCEEMGTCCGDGGGCGDEHCRNGYINLGIDWIICGAESGPGARPMDENWVRHVRDRCADSGTPFFYKQRLENGKKVSLPELDGAVHAAFPRSE